ncbi:MAG: PKD domain-containing protein [Euryarchaeota archaeon]|nr:PKD domain-containing protein [Euryarchaeota archaeon]
MPDPIAGYLGGERTCMDAMEIRRQALDTGIVTLSAQGRIYTFEVKPYSLMAPGATIQSLDESGQPVTIPYRQHMFRGKVPGTDIRATMSLNGVWVDAHIMDGERDIYIESQDPKGGVGCVPTVTYDSRGQPSLEPTTTDSARPASVVLAPAPIAQKQTDGANTGTSSSGGSASPGAPKDDPDVAAESRDGSPRMTTTIAKMSDAAHKRLELRITDTDPSPMKVLVKRAYVDQTVPEASFNVPFELVRGGKWLKFEVADPTTSVTIIGVPFDISADEGFSMGASSTASMSRRPMAIRVTQWPGMEESSVTVTDINGTRSMPTRHFRPLVMEITGPDTSGQTLRVNKTWLHSLGFYDASFRYADGTDIPSGDQGEAYAIHAPHFSTFIVDQKTKALWHFDEGSGRTVHDSTYCDEPVSPGNTNDARWNTATGSWGPLNHEPTPGFSGYFPLGFYSGTWLHVIPCDIAMGPATWGSSCQGTIEAAIFPMSAGQGEASGGIIFDEPYYFSLYAHGDTDYTTGQPKPKWQLRFSYNDNHPHWHEFWHPTYFSLDEWHHIAFSFDGGYWRLSVDGITQTYPSLGCLDSDYSDAYIGSGSNGDDQFYGYIDEVRVSKVERLAPANNFIPFPDMMVFNNDPIVNVDGSRSNDEDGYIASYRWDWHDGTTSTGPTASHEYEYSGDHEVTLNVTDDRGASAEVTYHVWISNALYETYVDIYVDTQYMGLYGTSSWFQEAEYTIGLVNDVYVPQVGLQYGITGMAQDGGQTSFDMPAAFDQFEDSFFSGIKELVEPTKWATFLSGKDFTGAADYGGTPRACLIGLGEEPSRADGSMIPYDPSLIFSIVQQTGDVCHTGHPVNTFERAYAVKHEFGHNHFGNHTYADDFPCVSMGTPSWCRTIMYGPFHLTFVDQFSDGTRDASHNNAARIRNWIVSNNA